MTAAGAGLGWGLPAALGAQLAAPDRPVVALMGDGGIHYAITALWTAATYKVPLTIVVASNAEYGILKQFAKIEHTTGVPGLDLLRPGHCCHGEKLRRSCLTRLGAPETLRISLLKP